MAKQTTGSRAKRTYYGKVCPSCNKYKPYIKFWNDKRNVTTVNCIHCRNTGAYRHAPKKQVVAEQDKSVDLSRFTVVSASKR